MSKYIRYLLGTGIIVGVTSTMAMASVNNNNYIQKTPIYNDIILKDDIGYKDVKINLDEETEILAKVSSSYKLNSLIEITNTVDNTGNIKYDKESFSSLAIKDKIQELEEEREQRELEEQRLQQELERQRQLEFESKLLMDNTQEVVTYASMEVPDVENDFKAFMDYRTLTSETSKQYSMQYDGNAITNDEGFRVYNGAYMVAVGTYYASECGVRLRVTLDTGKQFNCIVGDIKSDLHTDELHQHRNGNVIEFIVDQDKIPDICKKMGDMSYAPNADLSGYITNIEVIK